jgi:hypothetical protein
MYIVPAPARTAPPMRPPILSVAQMATRSPAASPETSMFWAARKRLRVTEPETLMDWAPAKAEPSSRPSMRSIVPPK